jgi:hypothetical protein
MQRLLCTLEHRLGCSRARPNLQPLIVGAYHIITVATATFSCRHN